MHRLKCRHACRHFTINYILVGISQWYSNHTPQALIILVYLMIVMVRKIVMRSDGLDQMQVVKYVVAMNELFQDEMPTFRHLREIEFLLSSAYRGYGYLVSKVRGDSFLSLKTDGTTFEISEYYVQELGGLYLPFFGVNEHLGKKMLGSPVGRIPKKQGVLDAESEKAEWEKPVCCWGVPFRGSLADINEIFKVGRHLSTCSLSMPLTILLMFMNLGVTEEKCRCIPIYLNQPDVNNRRVRVSDIFDERLCNKQNRGAKEFGTLETAWGDTQLSMNALKAVVFFYEVHSVGNHEDPRAAEIRPCLDSIHSGQQLVGRPFACKVSLDAAISLFNLFTQKDPSELFPEDFQADRLREEQLAHRLVCSVLVYIRQ